MSAILSADDLNDFITPGVACIKPVETLPVPKSAQDEDCYEVTTEDRVATSNATPASISLTDCLACSGCVTSAEAVLVSLQSHAEVLSTLDTYPELNAPETSDLSASQSQAKEDGKLFVASVSPQARASIAATFGVTERVAGNMITQLLSGPRGLRASGKHGSGFTWVIDTNVARQIALVAAADEVLDSIKHDNTTAEENDAQQPSLPLRDRPRRPVLTSACPGWICYAEKTHPHILPHISRVKSPQALTGTLVKSVLANKFGISPDRVWHLAIMPCFDKKLEASRAELTDLHWKQASEISNNGQQNAIRDVDCVITARELLMLADSRGISFPSLSPNPLSNCPPFPDPLLDHFFFPSRARHARCQFQSSPDRSITTIQTGTSGGYLWHVMQTHKQRHPGSRIDIDRGRNADVVEYTLRSASPSNDHGDDVITRSARYYGFRNIQNLVRKLKPKKQSRLPGAAARFADTIGKPGSSGAETTGSMSEYAYVEVMACPGGCSNGGGQIKVGDVGALRGSGIKNGSSDQFMAPSQKAWLQLVDEAYFSGSDDDDEHVSRDKDDDQMNYVGVASNDTDDQDLIDGISRRYVKVVMQHWAGLTGIALDLLVYTSYRRVESDVGKKSKIGNAERVAGLASSIGGGW